MITSLFISAVLSVSQVDASLPDEVSLHEGQSLIRSLKLDELMRPLKSQYRVSLEIDDSPVFNSGFNAGNSFVDYDIFENIDGECSECGPPPDLYNHEAAIALNPTIIIDPEVPEGSIKIERDVQSITFEVKVGVGMSEIGSAVLPIRISKLNNVDNDDSKVIMYRYSENSKKMEPYRAGLNMNSINFRIEPGKYKLIAFLGMETNYEDPEAFKKLYSAYESGRYQVIIDNDDNVINSKIMFATYYDTISSIIPWETSFNDISAYTEISTQTDDIFENTLVNIPGYDVLLTDNNKEVVVVIEHVYSGYRIKSKKIKVNVASQNCELFVDGLMPWVKSSERGSRLVSDVFPDHLKLSPGIFTDTVLGHEGDVNTVELLDFAVSPFLRVEIPLRKGYLLDPAVVHNIEVTHDGYESVIYGRADRYIDDAGNFSMFIKLSGCEAKKVEFPVEYVSATVPEIVLTDNTPIVMRIGDIKHIPMTIKDNDRNIAGVYAIAKNKKSNVSYHIGSYRFPSSDTDEESRLTSKISGFNTNFGKMSYDISLPLVPYDPYSVSPVMPSSIAHQGEYYLDIIAFDTHLNTRHKRLDLIIKENDAIDNRPFGFVYMEEGLIWPEDGYHQGEFSLTEASAGIIKIVTMDTIDDGDGEIVFNNPEYVDLYQKVANGPLIKIGTFDQQCEQELPIELSAGDYVIRSALSYELRFREGSPGKRDDIEAEEGVGLLGISIGNFPPEYAEFYSFKNYCPFIEPT